MEENLESAAEKLETGTTREQDASISREAPIETNKFECVKDESNESIGVMDDEVGEDEWLSEIKRAQRVAIEAARDNLISKDVQHMLKAPKSINSFATGELVLVEQGSSFRRGPEDKLLPFLAGPYEVVRVQSSEYTIRNCITRKTKVVHLGKLTKYTNSTVPQQRRRCVILVTFSWSRE